jgi:hypothetical protein
MDGVTPAVGIAELLAVAAARQLRPVWPPAPPRGSWLERYGALA